LVTNGTDFTYSARDKNSHSLKERREYSNGHEMNSKPPTTKKNSDYFPEPTHNTRQKKSTSVKKDPRKKLDQYE